MGNNYAAIILDIQHSRKYDDEHRFYIQDKLYSIIQFINEYYSKGKTDLLQSFPLEHKVHKSWYLQILLALLLPQRDSQQWMSR